MQYKKKYGQDKSYDRIIISEDLEPFSNNNYESIDKFIFEKLDSISDEAHDTQGNEISIILICSDRHQKGSSFLVKIFGIGLYNALLGSDRSMEEVCRLINKPRTKKEAKMYYKIDTDDVNYRSEHEDEVSELEIQNIISHFKKLGKDATRYANSFDNIAAQYTDEQLKIIINCLPITVKAILEETSPKYQEIMSVNGTLVRGVKSSTTATRQDEKRTGLKIDIIENKRNQSKITQPIVIPSSVKATKSSTAKKVISAQSQNVTQSRSTENPLTERKVQPTQKIARTQPEQMIKKRVESKQKGYQTQMNEDKKMIKKKQIEENEFDDDLILSREKKISNITNSKTVKPVHKIANITNKENRMLTKENESFDELEDIELPDLEFSNEVLNNQPIEKESVLVGEQPKTKKRGRPRKTPIEEKQKTKGKRGRPRKTVIQKEEIVDLEDIQEKEDDLNLNLFESDEITEKLDNHQREDFEFEDLIDIDEQDFDETSNLEDEYSEEVSIDELDNLDDLEEFEDEEDDFIEESFDEFDEYDEYGKYEAKSISEEEDIDDLYQEDILDDEAEIDLNQFDDIEDESTEFDEDFKSSDEENDLMLGLDDDILSSLDEEEDEELLDQDSLQMNYEQEEDSLSADYDLNDDFEMNHTLSENMQSDYNYSNYNQEKLESLKPAVDYSMSNLNSLMAKDKKIVTFLGSSKNGVSFLINNLAEIFASVGINTAILDMTKNRNSYYIYTQNEESLRKIAYTSIEKLQNGFAEGIHVKNNLTVYTALPNDGRDYSDAESILSTLVQKHSLILIDCDFDTDPSYFASCQEIYLVQSMDILTIQPLTAFLKELKTQGVLEPEKVKIVINKELKVRGLTNKAIIGGMSFYNDPAMSFMTELFNKDIVKYCSIPFEEMAYSKYLEAMLNCKVTLNGYSKNFMNKLRILGDMVYPLTSRKVYSSNQTENYAKNTFSNSMNDTLNKMKKKF